MKEKIGNGVAYLGDCLGIMDLLIQEGVKVDAIITDIPYGTTACKWDTIIPFPEMWERLNKLIKPNGAIVLFGSEPFSSALRMSNIKNYKYDWVWEKHKATGFLNVKRRPLVAHELIHVFYKNQCTYNQQKIKGEPYDKGFRKSNKDGLTANVYGNFEGRHIVNTTGERSPRSVIRFNTEHGLHPTQKSVALMEYLIKTYSNEGETVLDFTAGSFSTIIGCENTNRQWIGIEKDETYFNIGMDRLGKKK